MATLVSHARSSSKKMAKKGLSKRSKSSMNDDTQRVIPDVRAGRSDGTSQCDVCVCVCVCVCFFVAVVAGQSNFEEQRAAMPALRLDMHVLLCSL
jgi:hypothetical protein